MFVPEAALSDSKVLKMSYPKHDFQSAAAVRPEAVIKSAASAASPEGFPSRDQVGC